MHHALGPHSTSLGSPAFTELCLGENPSASPEGCTGNSLLKSDLVKHTLHITWCPLFVDLQEVYKIIFNFSIQKSASFEHFWGDTLV